MFSGSVRREGGPDVATPVVRLEGFALIVGLDLDHCTARLEWNGSPGTCAPTKPLATLKLANRLFNVKADVGRQC